MKIVICGSMSLSDRMIEIEKMLVANGHDVVLPKSADKYASGELEMESAADSVRNKIGDDLIRGHYESIKDSDAVVIANYGKNRIANYIGGNSFLEAGFAHVLGKKLYFVNDIPEISYRDELLALQPIILHGDLSKIR